jgi:hypothetical protein
MDRRTAAAWVASVVLSGCGGGGGNGVSVISQTAAPAADPNPSPSPTSAPPPAPAPVPPAATANSNIAAWGDSLTPPFALNLQVLYPARAVFNGGVGGQTSTEIASRQIADGPNHNTWINVFWYGQNNENAAAQIKADIAASVAVLAPGNNRFLVLSVMNKTRADEARGSPTYEIIIQLNRELAAIYPQNYVDMRAHLISHYDSTSAQDVIDFQNDVPPTSLRFPGDPSHLNNTASVLVAKKVKEFIDAKGW